MVLDIFGLELRFVSAYLRLGRRAPPHEEWDVLLDSNLPSIVAGDLNVNHPTRNSRTSNPYVILSVGLSKTMLVSSARLNLRTSPERDILRTSLTLLLPRPSPLIYKSARCRTFRPITTSYL